MNKKIAWTFVILIIVGLGGYVAYAEFAGTLPKPNMPMLSENPQPEVPTLPQDSVWEWQETKRVDGTGMTPVTDKPFIITFGSDRSFGIDGDCNQMGSTYLFGEGNALTLAPLFSTKMFCEGSREDEFAADISSVASYEVAGEELVLMLADDGVMRFVRVPQPL